MNPKVAQALAGMAPILETLLEAGAAAAGGPAAGAAATAVVTALNESGVVPTLSSAPVTSGTPPVGSVPANAGGILPNVPDPSAHPVLARAGQAPLVPQPTQGGSVPDTEDMNFPDVYARLAAVEQKLNAVITACGLQGSAALAAHP